MFRIELFVDDKNVGPALRALAGLALEQPKVMPVINATATKKNGVAAASPAGSLTDLFIEYLRKQTMPTLVRKDVDAFATHHGRDSTVAQNLLRQAMKRGALKQEGSGTGKKVIYRIVGGKK